MALVTTTDAAQAWSTIKTTAKNLSFSSQQAIGRLASTSVPLEPIFVHYKRMMDAQVQLNSLASAPNLTSYVQDVLNDGTYDVVAEITALSVLIQDARDWIDTNAGGRSLTGDTAENWITENSVAVDRFTPAQTSGLRTRLTAIVGAITL